VVGEKVALGAEIALQRKLPYIGSPPPRGAHQEGALSLMQMPELRALSRLARLAGSSSPSDPSDHRGVTASFAASPTSSSPSPAPSSVSPVPA